jgi:zinc protease
MTKDLFDPGSTMSFADRVTLQNFEGAGRLAIVTNTHAPTVTIVGMVQGGTAMVTDGRFSVPGITAAMLDRGTAEFSRMALARELEDHGLQLDIRNSGSAPASVSFTMQGLAEELPRMARILASVLRRPSFPDDELEKVRERILGILQHERQDTSSVAFGQLTRMIYPPGHPQRRREVDLRETEVRSVTRDDLELFHTRHYGGRSLVCAVVGDVEEHSVQQLLGDALFGWGAETTTLPPTPNIPLGEPGRIDTPLPDRPNLDVFLGHAGRLLLGDDDYAAAVLANSCLGQSTLTSRLGVAVRDKAGLTYGINSAFVGTLQIPGPWVISLSVGPENLDRALILCRQVLKDFLESGPTEAELDDERLAWVGGYKVGLATNAGVAMELVKTLLTGQAISRMDLFPNEVLTVGRDTVTQALRRHIDPDRLTVSVAGTLEE